MASEIELQKKYYEEGKVFILQIESNLACPQMCRYCYAGSLPNSTERLSSKKIKELLESAVKLDVRMIDWLGGDPLVRKDWYELCRYSSKLGFINNIWTSGIPLANANIAEKVVEVTRNGFISTHLDTIDPILYKKLHGNCDSEANLENIGLILKGIENVIEMGKDSGAMVNCVTYTTPLAEGDTKGMISYMQERFGIKTCLTLFNPVIHRNANKDWEPNRAQIEDAFSHRDKVNYSEDPSCGAMDVSKFYCGTVICVTANGWLTPCSVIRTEEFGNIYDEPLEILVERKRNRLLFLDFRDPSKLPGHCCSCENNSVCFGCRSSAYYYEGDILAMDPKCFNFVSSDAGKQKNEN